MEDIKVDTGSMLQQSEAHHMNQQNSSQHFSPVATTAVQEMPRQTVLMWGSNHMQPTTARSPSTTEYNSVAASEGCEALKNLAEINSPEICKWNGDAKSEPVAQSSEAESPHQHHTHHNHHNNRVVMVL